MANGEDTGNEELNSELTKFWQSSGFASELASDIADGGEGETKGWIAKNLTQWLDELWANLKDGDQFASDAIQQVINKMLAEFEVPEEFRDRIIAEVDKLTTEVPIVQTALSAFATVLIAVTTVGSELLVLGSMLQKGALNTLRPTTGGYQDLLAYQLRKGLPEREIQKSLGELGLSDKWWEIIREGARPKPGLAELGELFRRGNLNPDELKKRIKALGFTEDKDVEGLTDIQSRLADVGLILEALRRNSIEGRGDNVENCASWEDSAFDARSDVPSAQTLLQQLGYTPELAKLVTTTWPRIVSPSDLFDIAARSDIEDQELICRLMRAGYKSDDAGELTLLKDYWPTPSDIVQFGVKDVFTPEVANTFGLFDENPRRGGITPNDAAGRFDEFLKASRLKPEGWDLQWASHWRLPAPGQGFDMWHRGLIKDSELDALLKALDYPPFWRPKVKGLSYRLVPRRVITRLLMYGIINEATAFDMFRMLGYDPIGSSLMIQDGLHVVGGGDGGLTQSEILSAYRRGLMEEKEARDSLTSIGVLGNRQDLLIALSKLDRQDREQLVSYEIDSDALGDSRRNLQREVLKAVSDGAISSSEAASYLVDLGYSKTTAESMISTELFERAVEDQEFKARQIKRQYMAYAVNEDQAKQRLSTFEFSSANAKRLVEQWKLERETDRLVDAAKVRQPTRTNFEDWLKKGIIDADAFYDGLKELGYTDEHIYYFLVEVTDAIQAQ